MFFAVGVRRPGHPSDRPILLFINGENLTDVRHTRWEPLVRPARRVDGRWTVDAWAALGGRNINGDVRISF